MSASLNRILHQSRDAGTSASGLEAIVHACRQVNYTAWRDRLPNPAVTMQASLLHVLHGNTACARLPHLAGRGFTASASLKARSKLPLGLFEAILRSSVRSLQAAVDAAGRWHGPRTFLGDGSGASMPDTPALQEAFVHPTGQRPGCGSPVAHPLGRSHAATGLLLQLLVDPLRAHDIAAVPKLHPQLEPGDLLVTDRGFCSYGPLALLLRDGLRGLLRVPGRMVVDFTPHRPHVTPGSRRSKSQGKGPPWSRWLRGPGPEDQLVEWLKPASAPPWMAPKVFAASPEALVARELRYRVDRPGSRGEVTLVITPLDGETYPKEDLSRSYLQRWEQRPAWVTSRRR
ncbi:IS4/IS5 family transposase [Tautonia plasticadhaerens]|uniref:IS4/IS5 family transposase n=1 Tax=Tautonia plasticadhaerens TaxID=2527974 RepID=UPI0011A911E9|nr:IS4/IS5 family transposase [Tautonia plasticadhaerens]